MNKKQLKIETMYLKYGGPGLIDKSTFSEVVIKALLEWFKGQ